MATKIYHKGKSLVINAKKVSFLGKASGLMFKSSSTDNLIFEFKNKTSIKIHSMFVFFPFLAVWLDEKNKVIDFKLVKPFTPSISPKKPYLKLIEIPKNKKNGNILKFFVGGGKI